MFVKLTAALILAAAPIALAFADSDNPDISCYYQLDSDRDTHIKLAGNKLTLTVGGERKTMDVAILKVFGHLTSAAIEGAEPDAKVHYFTEREIDGQKVLFFDAVSFEQQCEAGD